jgi:hypothetical protein
LNAQLLILGPFIVRELFQRLTSAFGSPRSNMSLTLQRSVCLALVPLLPEAITLTRHRTECLPSTPRSVVLRLSERDRKVFVDLLLNPPAPSARLVAAAKRYKQRKGRL